MSDIRKHLVRWNNQYPLDRWWRLKYKIPFGSQQHLEISQYDIYCEYVEDLLFNEQQPTQEQQYIAGANNWLKDQYRSDRNVLAEDDSVSLENIQFGEDGTIKVIT